jgi:hypothetical protein
VVLGTPAGIAQGRKGCDERAPPDAVTDGRYIGYPRLRSVRTSLCRRTHSSARQCVEARILNDHDCWGNCWPPFSSSLGRHSGPCPTSCQHLTGESARVAGTSENGRPRSLAGPAAGHPHDTQTHTQDQLVRLKPSQEPCSENFPDGCRTVDPRRASCRTVALSVFHSRWLRELTTAKAG